MKLLPSQKYEMLKLFFIVVLLIVSFLSSYLYITNKPKNLVIAIEDGMVRVISENNIIPQELNSFIEMFLKYSYNYSYLNLKENIDKSSNLMSELLWEKKRNEIASSIDKLNTQKLNSQLIDIKSLNKISDTEYLINIIQKLEAVDKKFERKLQVRLFIGKKSSRTKDNPSIYEVTNYEEIEAN